MSGGDHRSSRRSATETPLAEHSPLHTGSLDEWGFPRAECESRSDIAYVAHVAPRLRFLSPVTVQPRGVRLSRPSGGMRVAERHRLRSRPFPRTGKDRHKSENVEPNGFSSVRILDRFSVFSMLRGLRPAFARPLRAGPLSHRRSRPSTHPGNLPCHAC